MLSLYLLVPVHITTAKAGNVISRQPHRRRLRDGARGHSDGVAPRGAAAEMKGRRLGRFFSREPGVGGFFTKPCGVVLNWVWRPKWNPSKWKGRLKPAEPQPFSFEPHPILLLVACWLFVLPPPLAMTHLALLAAQAAPCTTVHLSAAQSRGAYGRPLTAQWRLTAPNTAPALEAPCDPRIFCFCGGRVAPRQGACLYLVVWSGGLEVRGCLPHLASKGMNLGSHPHTTNPNNQLERS